MVTPTPAPIPPLGSTVSELQLPNMKIDTYHGSRYDVIQICFNWEEGHAYEVEITDYH